MMVRVVYLPSKTEAKKTANHDSKVKNGRGCAHQHNLTLRTFSKTTDIQLSSFKVIDHSTVSRNTTPSMKIPITDIITRNTLIVSNVENLS